MKFILKGFSIAATAVAFGACGTTKPTNSDAAARTVVTSTGHGSPSTVPSVSTTTEPPSTTTTTTTPPSPTTTVPVNSLGTQANAEVQQIANELGTTPECSPEGSNPLIQSAPDLNAPGLPGIESIIMCDYNDITVYVFQDSQYLQNEISAMGYQNGIDLIGADWEAAVGDSAQGEITDVQSAIGGTIVNSQ